RGASRLEDAGDHGRVTFIAIGGFDNRGGGGKGRGPVSPKISGGGPGGFGGGEGVSHNPDKRVLEKRLTCGWGDLMALSGLSELGSGAPLLISSSMVRPTCLPQLARNSRSCSGFCTYVSVPVSVAMKGTRTGPFDEERRA